MEQRKVERMVFLDPSFVKMPDVDSESLKIFGLENFGSKFAKQAASLAADFIPYFGTAKAISELILGYDHISGEPVSRIISAFALFGSIAPVPGAAGAAKAFGRSVVYGAEALAKNPELVTKGIARMMRARPGKVSGGESLKVVKAGDTWMRGTHGNIAKIPKQIADKLRGREFRNFDHFRTSFWKEIANDPVLSKSFSKKDIYAMKELGKSPAADMSQWDKSIKSYILHHINPIHNGGGVYDIDNLLIVTPRYHKEILYSNFHYNKK